MTALAADGSLVVAINYSFGFDQDCRSPSAESSEDDLERVAHDNFSFSFVGSSGGGPEPPRAARVPINQFVGCLHKIELAGRIDVMEIVGGNAGVGKVAIRRRLRGGGDIDFVTGFDSTKPGDQRHVLAHITEHKPLVIILAPPCISFGHWSHLNRVLHPATWSQFRRIGELYAAFAANVMLLQLDASRHFLLENPAGSGFFELDSFKKMWTSGGQWSLTFHNAPEGSLWKASPYTKTQHFGRPVLFCLNFSRESAARMQGMEPSVGCRVRQQEQSWHKCGPEPCASASAMAYHSYCGRAAGPSWYTSAMCTQLENGRGVAHVSHPWV